MRRTCHTIRSAAAAAAIVALVAPSGARAGDFFSSFFGALTGRAVAPPPLPPMPFAVPGERPAPQASSAPRGRGSAYCVRTCDGRYFPLPASGGQSRAAVCQSFCPASATKVVYGSTIDNAVTDNGKPYSELPNAYRYRDEVVSGCTCNGKDAFGLAQIPIEHDRTVRKGDLVAGPDGLMVATGGSDRRGAALNFSPVTAAPRVGYEKLPVVAAQ